MDFTAMVLTFGAIFVVVVLLILVWTSYYTVAAESEGVVLRFGKFFKTVEPGLHFKLPLGIDEVSVLPTRRQLKLASRRVRTVRPASGLKARAATVIAATSSIATRATATRVVVATRASAAAVISADATRAAATSAIAAPRTVNGRPAPPRAIATVRSIPIRHLQNWRR